jgi:hypothetical protein
MDGKVSRTQVSMIRNGCNWSYLFEKENMSNIPSLPNNGGYSGKIKIEIVDKLNSGIGYEALSKEYTNISKSDLKRIEQRQVWSKVWKVYDHFFN